MLDRPIEKPMFVFGLPCTGTTLTINLLSADPMRRCFLRWEAFATVPPAKHGELRSDKEMYSRAPPEQVAARLGNRIRPGYRHTGDFPHAIAGKTTRKSRIILSPDGIDKTGVKLTDATIGYDEMIHGAPSHLARRVSRQCQRKSSVRDGLAPVRCDQRLHHRSQCALMGNSKSPWTCLPKDWR